MVVNVISLQPYCERSEAIQDLRKNWIASSQRSSQRHSERIKYTDKILNDTAPFMPRYTDLALVEK